VENLGQDTYMAHFEALGEREMSPIEFDAYTASLRIHNRRVDMTRDCSSTYKDGHVTVHLVDAALGHDEGDKKSWRYDKSVRLIVL
jgi:hypothetical protein